MSVVKRAHIAAWVFGLATFFVVCPVLVAMADDPPAEGETAPAAAKQEESPSKLKALLGYGLSIGGFVVVAALVVHTLAKNMKYETARNALVHLLRTNPNQAEVQCRTMPNTFYDPVAAAIKGGAMTKSQDPAILMTATLPSYDAIGGVVSQHWKGLVGKSKLAVLAAVGAIAIKPAILTVILGVLAVAGLLWLFYYKAEVDRSIMRARVEIMPDIERAFVDGRYYFQS
jgi:hypothetical protein